ncbi:MAG: band 7 protein, partial [Deltaproteobacteria bacterium]
MRVLGGAKATALQKVDEERANGLALKTAVFNDSRAYAMWRFVDSLNPDLKLNIIHAGEGTLWTDLK